VNSHLKAGFDPLKPPEGCFLESLFLSGQVTPERLNALTLGRAKTSTPQIQLTIEYLDQLVNMAKAQGVKIDANFEKAYVLVASQLTYERNKTALFIFKQMQDRKYTHPLAQMKTHIFREVVKYL